MMVKYTSKKVVRTKLVDGSQLYPHFLHALRQSELVRYFQLLQTADQLVLSHIVDIVHDRRWRRVDVSPTRKRGGEAAGCRRSCGGVRSAVPTACLGLQELLPQLIVPQPWGRHNQFTKYSKSQYSLFDKCLLQVGRHDGRYGVLGWQYRNCNSEGAVSVTQAVAKRFELTISVSDTDNVPTNLFHQDAVGHIRLAHTHANFLSVGFRILAPNLHLLLRKTVDPFIDIITIVRTHGR